MRSWSRTPSTGTATAGTVESNITGQVTNSAGGAAVAGCIIELCNASGVVQSTQVSDGSGNYTFTNATEGEDYILNLQPAEGYARASAEDGALSAARTGGHAFTHSGAKVKNWSVTASYFHDDFQSYADVTALKNATTGVGGSAKTNCSSNQVNEPTFATIQLTTDGPASSKTMKYLFSDTGSNCAGGTIGMDVHFETNSFDNCYMRWMDYISTDWKNGLGSTCSPPENDNYKFWLSWWRKSAGGNAGANLFIDNGPTNIRFWADMEGNGVNYGTQTNPPYQGCTFPGSNPCSLDTTNGVIYGQWNVWVVEILGVDTTTMSYTLYRNGDKVFSFNGNMTHLNKFLDFIQIGANINSSPRTTQYRLFRSVSVSTHCPAIVDVVS